MLSTFRPTGHAVPCTDAETDAETDETLIFLATLSWNDAAYRGLKNCARAMREAAVAEPGGWVRLLTPAEIGARLLAGGADVVMSLGDYERDLGMPSAAQVRRQLEVDLRAATCASTACARGAPTRSSARRRTRACTQAVAPVVEWLLHAGWIAHGPRRRVGALAVEVTTSGAATRASAASACAPGRRLGRRGDRPVHGDARRHTLVATVVRHGGGRRA